MSYYLPIKVSKSVKKLDNSSDIKIKEMHVSVMNQLAGEVASYVRMYSGGQLTTFLSYTSTEYFEPTASMYEGTDATGKDNLTILKFVGKELYLHFQNYNVLSNSNYNLAYVNNIRMWIANRPITGQHFAKKPTDAVYIGDIKYSTSFSNSTDAFMFGIVGYNNGEDFFIGLCDCNYMPFSGAGSTTHYIGSFLIEHMLNQSEKNNIVTVSCNGSTDYTFFSGETPLVKTVASPLNNGYYPKIFNTTYFDPAFANCCIKFDRPPVFLTNTNTMQPYRYKNVILFKGAFMRSHNLYNIENKNYYLLENDFALRC